MHCRRWGCNSPSTCYRRRSSSTPGLLFSQPLFLSAPAPPSTHMPPRLRPPRDMNIDWPRTPVPTVFPVCPPAPSTQTHPRLRPLGHVNMDRQFGGLDLVLTVALPTCPCPPMPRCIQGGSPHAQHTGGGASRAHRRVGGGGPDLRLQRVPQI